MNTKLKIGLAFTMLASVLVFFSCSNDDELSQATNASKDAYVNQVYRQSLMPHKLTITNNSRYNFAISSVNAQSNYDLDDPMNIFHRSSRAMLVLPGSSVTFYDYKQVSDSHFQISSWHVIKQKNRIEDLGDFECDAIANLYGMLSVPGNPQSLRYPVWKSIEGAPVDGANQPLAIIGVNNHDAELSYNIGNLAQGFSTIIKYGKVTGMGSSESLTTDPSYAIWLATAIWKQNYVSGSSNNGNITITIENNINR